MRRRAGRTPRRGELGTSISASGFVGAFADGFTIPACTAFDRLHAQIVIGGRARRRRGGGRADPRRCAARDHRHGDPERRAAARRARPRGRHRRQLSDRATTDASGAYTLHVPTESSVELTAFRRGDALGRGGDAGGAIALPPSGAIHVTATEGTTHVPVRVQVTPAAGQACRCAAGFGEPELATGRLHIAFPVTGDITLAAPPGMWNVIVSRGYEYELVEQPVTVTQARPPRSMPQLDRSVATPNVQCGDFTSTPGARTTPATRR